MGERVNLRFPLYGGPERRRYMRVNKIFIASFRIRPEGVAGGDFADWNPITMQNLGAGGAFFNYNTKIDPDTAVELRINFPLSRSRIDCVGRVRRFDVPPNSLISSAAVEFTEIGEVDKELINKAVEMAYSKESA